MVSSLYLDHLEYEINNNNNNNNNNNKNPSLQKKIVKARSGQWTAVYA
jgi:hypothetical protein